MFSKKYYQELNIWLFGLLERWEKFGKHSYKGSGAGQCLGFGCWIKPGFITYSLKQTVDEKVGFWLCLMAKEN